MKETEFITNMEDIKLKEDILETNKVARDSAKFHNLALKLGMTASITSVFCNIIIVFIFASLLENLSS